jgi:hypothetical protein
LLTDIGLLSFVLRDSVDRGCFRRALIAGRRYSRAAAPVSKGRRPIGVADLTGVVGSGVHSSILPHLIVLVTMLSGPGAPFNRPWCGIMTLVSFPAPTDPSEIGHDHRADGAEPSPLGDRLPDAATGETQEVTAVELPDEQIAIARSAAVEDAGDAKQVGEYLGATREDEIALTAALVGHPCCRRPGPADRQRGRAPSRRAGVARAALAALGPADQGR